MLGWAELGRAKLGRVTQGPIIVVSVVIWICINTISVLNVWDCPKVMPSDKNSPNIFNLQTFSLLLITLTCHTLVHCTKQKESLGDWTILWGLG